MTFEKDKYLISQEIIRKKYEENSKKVFDNAIMKKLNENKEKSPKSKKSFLEKIKSLFFKS